MSWGTVLSLVGVAASLWGSQQQADAASSQANASAASIAETAAHNAAISRYDASVARKTGQEYWYKTNQEITQHRKASDRFLGAQRTSFAKSGVAVGGDTPLDTMSLTADELIRDQKTIAYEGLKDIQAAESLATRYDKLAEFGLRDAAAQASLISQAGSDASTSAWISGITSATTQTYNLGYNEGWWS